MWQIEHAGEVWIDGLATSGQVGESGLFASVTLLSLKLSDRVTDCVGAVCGAPLGDLGVERDEFTVVEADGDLRGHLPSIALT